MKENRMLAFEFKKISNLIKRKIDYFMDESSDTTMTGMQGFVIGYLNRNRGRDIFQRDIEAECKIRRSTATGILQLMEKNNWIERHSVPEDARLKKLVLTQKAIEHDQKFHANMEKIEAQARQGLTAEEIEDFFRILDKIEKNFE